MAVCICHLRLGRLRQKGQPMQHSEALSQKLKEANETKMGSHKHKFYLQGKKVPAGKISSQRNEAAGVSTYPMFLF